MTRKPILCGNRMNIHIPTCDNEPTDDTVWVDVTGRVVDCHTVGSAGYGVYDIVVHATASKLDGYFEQGRTVKVRDRLDRSNVPSYPSINGVLISKAEDLAYYVPFPNDITAYCTAESANSMPTDILYCLY